MNADAREPWDELMRRLARAKGFRRLTPEEALAEYDAAAPVALPKDQIDRIVRNVVAGRLPPRPHPAPQPSEHGDAVDEEMLALNRNAGELDADTKRKLDELRKEALDGDGGGEDEIRLDD